MIFKGKQEYPVILEKIAEEMATLRSKLSADVYHEGSETHRGKQEHEISKLGILAELVAQNFLVENSIPFKSATLVDVQPLPEPDIVIDGKLIDVKGVKQSTTNLYVNYKAHLNSKKKCDFYWFVKLMPDYTAEHYLVAHSEVSNWQVKELRYTKAFVNKLMRKEQYNENSRVYAT